MTNDVTTALKTIRKNAGVGLREMARRLGVAPSTYQHYEDPNRFKSDYLPMEEALRFADALESNGVDRRLILALAGADTGVDARMKNLSPERRERMLHLLDDLEAAQKADQAHQERTSPGQDEV